jgi:hypothetical protein
VSVADAHIGALIATSETHRFSVVTSDPDDIRSVAGTKPVAVVRL